MITYLIIAKVESRGEGMFVSHLLLFSLWLYFS